jgi:hypothetical protein
MYRCQVCGCVVPPRTPASRLVLATRPKRYPGRPKAHRVIRLSETNKLKVVLLDDPGGSGREIAREVLACPSCAARERGG